MEESARRTSHASATRALLRHRHWTQPRRPPWPDSVGRWQALRCSFGLHPLHRALRSPRTAEHQASEAMKEANCRVCPSCAKPVERLSGCDSMVCGSDYHGGNRQAGCGNAFNWNAAPRYVRPGGEAARVPRSFEEVGFADVGTGRHALPDGTFRRCDACRTEIAGPRFSCIHCLASLECCNDCSISGEALAALGHTASHAFSIIFPGAAARAMHVDEPAA